MPQTQEYFINNIDSLSITEIRSYNTLYLHKNDQRICSKCKTIFNGIRDNFHIKRYHGPKENRKPSYCVHCKECRNEYLRGHILKMRRDPKAFINRTTVQTRNRAKELGVEHNLDTSYLVDLFYDQAGLCYYTGLEISFEFTAIKQNCPHRLTPSLDRLNPTLGYVKGNVAWCAYFINRMKNDCSFEEFITYCAHITKRFSK